MLDPLSKRVEFLVCLVISLCLSVCAGLRAAEVTTSDNSGPGSLRAAIEAAVDGETITFAPGLDGLTIELLSPLPPISETLIIDTTSLPTGLTVELAGGGNLLRTEGGANLTLLGDGVYLGNAVVDSGQLTIHGQIIGDSTVGGGGTLIVNTGGSIDGDAVVNGGGLLNVEGSINGDASVSAGARLNVAGMVWGETTVAANGTLDGTGMLGGNTTSSGNLSAGNFSGDISTLAFGSDLTISDGIIRVDINDAGTTPGVNNDLYQVDGNVTLDGGTVDVSAIAGSYTDGAEYTFLTAGGILSGTFSEITDNLPFYETLLLYDANSVRFRLSEINASFEEIGKSCNQASVGGYLDTLRDTAAGDLLEVINTLRGSTSESIQSGLDQLGGQIYPSLVAIQVQHTSFSLAMLRDQLVLDTLYRRSNQPMRGWVRGYGIGGDADGDKCGTHGFGYRLGGTEIGLQRSFGPSLDLGLFANLAWSKVETSNIRQDADVDSYQFGGTLQYNGGYGYLLGIGGAGFQDYDTRRSITIGNDAIDRIARSEFDGSQSFGFIEYGKLFLAGQTGWIPHFSMQYIEVDQDAIQESGADAVNLSGESIRADSLRSILGLSIQQSGATRIGPATTKLRFGWMHEYLDDRQDFTANFSGETENVTVRGIDLGRDWAIIGMNLQWSMFRYFNLLAGYQGQFNNTQSLHTGAAGLEMRW